MLRLTKTGGEMAEKGNYWNVSTGEKVCLTERQPLPGGASASYHRFPPVIMLAAAPVLGLAYAVFLPFIGIAMLAAVVGRKIFGGALHGAWKGASFSWKPSEAYLSGRKGRAGKTGKGKKDA